MEIKERCIPIVLTTNDDFDEPYALEWTRILNEGEEMCGTKFLKDLTTLESDCIDIINMLLEEIDVDIVNIQSPKYDKYPSLDDYLKLITNPNLQKILQDGVNDITHILMYSKLIVMMTDEYRDEYRESVVIPFKVIYKNKTIKEYRDLLSFKCFKCDDPADHSVIWTDPIGCGMYRSMGRYVCKPCGEELIMQSEDVEIY